MSEYREPILEVENLRLKYSFYKSQPLKEVMLKRNRKKKNEFEALKGVSFKLEHGTNLGVIGSNGSGKSTLLRVLANTLTPDSGKIINRAKSVSLLSLGVGFKPELSGHENIYLCGLLLGLSQKELDARMDEIINFSEIGEFISNPVRTYSSGMRSKLAFSIAVNVDPDLLLIDELFSVGDERFREKSKKKMEEMILDDRTVVMVSHNTTMIKQYCQKVLWIEEGILKGFGDPNTVVNNYLDFMN
ncbi:MULTISPECIES: ABC transporter ATP-binding protein [unclassified Oceanispirochaeta]|uniref:ABC transporter ATP-binding protein n=1 Tax=unclassified Oceanispirochaeta TaxID=2635722 RepID=UPI000E09B3BF|nr:MULTISPECIES: ABC transporter ATP-binding protein [unclassified Oceanispirochaeta]MBF9014421.1 ABC transporter ATP-binding protein [Oceanispirochaeta sp. M2]NPD74975.1 ABC transporter ATP-binding protein [Oceanispirochaeta sp. M1]RDG29151.1 ABC transporter ATP-binding protein [Oceanispirochaeta sp. M1]